MRTFASFCLLICCIALFGNCNNQDSATSSVSADSANLPNRVADSPRLQSTTLDASKWQGPLPRESVRTIALRYQDKKNRDRSRYVIRQMNFDATSFKKFYSLQQLKFIATTTPRTASRPSSDEPHLVIKSKINLDSVYFAINDRFPNGEVNVCNSTNCPALPPSNNVFLTAKQVQDMLDYYLSKVDQDSSNAIQQIDVDGSKLIQDISGAKSFALIPAWKKNETQPFIIVQYRLPNGTFTYKERKSLFSICPPPRGCETNLLQ